MIDRQAFAQGLAELASAFRAELSDPTVETYYKHLAPLFPDVDSWDRAVGRAIKGGRFFPTVAEILQAAQDAPPATMAMVVYQEIVEAFERGQRLGHRDVAKRWSRGAADAFMAAGGEGVFMWCEPRDQPFRQKRFLDAWVDIVRHEPELLAGARVSPELPEGTGA